MANLKALVAILNRDTRKSVENFISAEAQASVAMEGWSPVLRGSWEDDPNFNRASELAGVLYEACLDAGLEDFEVVRRGLAAAYEGIVRPQGHSFQEAWKEVLSVWIGKRGAVPQLEKGVARILIKEARKRRLEAEGHPSSRVVVHRGDFIAVYKGGKWAVGMK